MCSYRASADLACARALCLQVNAFGFVAAALATAACLGDGSAQVNRQRPGRNFGLDNEMLVYSPEITLGNRLLKQLQREAVLPSWVAERHCIASLFHIDHEEDVAHVAVVTLTLLQVDRCRLVACGSGSR